MNKKKELSEEEKAPNFPSILNDLEQGRMDIERITQRMRYDLADYIRGKVVSAISEGPEAISEIKVRKTDSQALSNGFYKIMNGLFYKGSAEIEKEIDRQRNRIQLRDEEPEIKEIKELFLARARAMSLDITHKIERAAQLYAEDLWRTLGEDGITSRNIDELVDQIVGVADREGKKAAIKNVSESYSLGRHYKAMKYKDDIAFAYYSSLMDQNTCIECAAVDGTRVKVGSKRYYNLMPPHRDCNGRGACRCIYIYIMKDEYFAHDNIEIQLHNPGGIGHNQKLHGNRTKSAVGEFFQSQYQTEEEKNRRIIHGEEELTLGEDANIRDNWTAAPYEDIAAMRERVISGRENFDDRYLISNIEKCPTMEGVMYRGMSFDNQTPNVYNRIKEQFVEGAEINMPIASFSLSRDIISDFAGLMPSRGSSTKSGLDQVGFTERGNRVYFMNNTNSVVIKAQSKTGRYIGYNSKYSSEEEVVVLPNTKFRITGTKTVTQSKESMGELQQIVRGGINLTKPSQMLIIEMEEL